MTPELSALVVVALLQIVMVFVAQRGLNADVGREGNVGPRDGGLQLSDQTMRLRRAVDNHVENIGLFIIAVLVLSLAQKTSTLSAVCAWTYVAARALYLPAYAFGWTPWRSLIWLVGLSSTLIMLVAALV